MTTLEQQLAALRDGAACCLAGVRGAIRVEGADHRAWLERVASNPVASLEAGTCTDAVFMDGKGRMHADVRLMAAPSDDAILIDAPATAVPKLTRVLDMYVIGEDVRLTDLSDELAFVSLLGPQASAVAEQAALPCPTAGRVETSADGLLALASGLAGTGGMDLLAPVDQTEALLQRLSKAGCVAVEAAALEIVRIEHGVPRWETDLSDGVIPYEAGLDRSVSVTKGCYPGQEVVARIHNLGQVSRRLVRLSAPGEASLEPGSELTGSGEQQGRKAGAITSVAFDAGAGCTWALGFVRRAFWAADTALQAGDVRLEVLGLCE